MKLEAPLTQHDNLVPPWSLTASDGSGLQLVRIDAKAVAVGPLAFTELHLYFHNGEARRREGTFQIALPPHASIARFAMENDGKWMEAEVVGKQLARRAYDDFLHRRQDPALLEKAEGNQFTAKVFPIAPNADKHIVVAYTQELPAARYALALRGLPKVARVDVELALTSADGQRTRQVLTEHDWQPDHDFVSTADAGAAAVGAGALVVAQLPVLAGGLDDAPTSEPPGAIELLVDTSASRALGYEHYVGAVHALVAELGTRYGAQLPLDVVAFDQDTQTIFTGRAGDYATDGDRALVARGAAGASDLGQALASLKPRPHAHVVVITDGMITAGRERPELVDQLKARADIERVDVVLAGGLRDAELAGALVRTSSHAGAVLDLDDHAEQVARALGERVAVDVPVEVSGAIWTYPHTIATARPGTTAVVYARLAAPARTLDVRVGGEHRQIAVVAGDAPLVERAVTSAEIDELEDKVAGSKPDDARPLRAELIKRAVAARVVSSETSMLVLETDADYERYGIDRRALAEVLVVGPGGLEHQHREPLQIAAAAPPTIKGEAKSAAKDKRERLLAFEKTSGERNEDTGTGTALALDEGKMGKRDRGDSDADGIPDTVDGPDQAGSAVVITSAVDVTGRVARPEVVIAASAPPPAPPPPHPLPQGAPAQPSPHGFRSLENFTAQAQISQRAVAASGGEQGQGGAVASPTTRDDSPSGLDENRVAPLTGDLAAIERALAKHDIDHALGIARAWHARAPGDVLALIGMGDALEAKRDLPTAARMYGSIIDLFPGRADLRRFAGERIERLAARDTAAWDLIVDTYRRAVADRPDHVTGHRLLAYALVRAGKPADAFAAILAGYDHGYPSGRFLGWERVLGDDAGLIGAAYAASAPKQRATIVAELGKRNLGIATEPSTRFILYWETDGNDVDFHIHDAIGGHAWYGSKVLPSGGELYADITTGYGPECFAIPGTPKAGPYQLMIHYFSQGPMGYGMGLVEIERFDGHGKLTFEDRPYVIMQDHASVDLGTYK
jgi:hypothetical protein